MWLCQVVVLLVRREVVTRRSGCEQQVWWVVEMQGREGLK